MKLSTTLITAQLLSSVLTEAAVFFDKDAIKLSCDDTNINAISTPGTPVNINSFGVDTTNFDQTILLKPIPASTAEDGTGTMCILSSWTKALDLKEQGQGFYFSLGKSIDGNDWERPAGKGGRQVEYVCGEAGEAGTNFVEGEYLCEVTLPKTSKILIDGSFSEFNAPYFMTYYERSLTVRNELSRFLHKTTFGPTSSELDALEIAFAHIMATSSSPSTLPSASPSASPTELPSESPTVFKNSSSSLPSAVLSASPMASNSSASTSESPTTATPSASPSATPKMTHSKAMALLQTEWVAAQMDPSTFSTGKFSSLREYWRKRLNPRTAETYRIGESGPPACEKNSRWRKFAFTYNDVMNSQYLRWGNIELGGSYQSADPHLVTIETIEFFSEEPTSSPSVSQFPSTSGPTFSPTFTTLPSSSPTASFVPSWTSAPSYFPTNSSMPSSSDMPSSSVPTASPTVRDSVAPSLSMAPSTLSPTSSPTFTNLLGYGNIEGNEKAVLSAWPSKCERSIISRDPNATESNPDIYGGDKSLSVIGGKCFVMRLIGPDCLKSRLSENLNEGDTVRIALKVKMSKPNTVFQMESAHYHTDKAGKRWSIPTDDSHIISRTTIKNAGEWTHVEAIHTVGPDWTFNGQVLAPKRCNHYQLRFRAANSNASFFLDNVHLEKVESLQSLEVQKGFITNPDFVLDHKYWKYAPTSGFVAQDEGRNAMVLTPGKIMRQDVLDTAVPNEKYIMSFWAKLVGMESVDVKILLRMRFRNNDLVYGPCPRKTCVLYERPLRAKLTGSGSWQRIVAEEFNMFGNYTDWDGNVDFILFELTPMKMPAGAELRVANFDFTDRETAVPSMSSSPSISPTTLMVKNVGYVVRYAGEIRTVVHKPFQLAQTGEAIPMDRSYKLCFVDEVEGEKLENYNRMSFFYQKQCKPIFGGNPTVDLDPRYVNMNDLHILEMTTNTSITEINTELTLGGDLLLQSDIEDDVCSTFPSPYDNDYRGADPFNLGEKPSRFNPDKPVFALLPDGSYALYDPRLILHENTLENPLMDGGGTSVLRSTLRADKGFEAHQKEGETGDFYVFNDKNIALCVNEQPNFLNQGTCKLSYEPNTCAKQYGRDGGKYGNLMLDVQLVITFDDKTLAAMHNATLATSSENATLLGNATSIGDVEPRYIYAVSDLRYDDTNTDGIIIDLPCSPGNPTSRWVPRKDLTNENCTNNLQEDTVNVLKFALESSNDENEFLRDIVLWNSVEDDGCNPIDEMEYGMVIMTNEGCWGNVHPDHLSVFDFTKYVTIHPTAKAISSFVNTGMLVYPSNHSMTYFEDLKDKSNSVTRVARYGDKMIVDQFADLLLLNVDPSVLMAIASNMGNIMLDNMVQKNRDGGVLVCGSPNEVAPDPELDDYFDVRHNDLDCVGCQNSYENYFAQKQTVWTLNMLQGEDQLCQRMAWALYEHLNVGTTTMPDNTETNLYSYDILTRHCFGNYFDVLKEMSYNPKMAEQFNFVDSSSTRFHWDAWWEANGGVGKLVFPDENFAREIMQLFTIGLHQLEFDGSETRDEFGRMIQTYTNEDIMTNARIWTGFVYTARRGNTEELFRASKSRFEPLRIDVNKHDFFPKTSVDDGWIGDRYPLCIDLPKHHFLKMGAKYRFRGGSSLPSSQYMPDSWDGNEEIKRFVLSPDSSLYQKLCNPDVNGDCDYASTITLDENLDCTGKECRIDTLVIVQVAPGAFYEYIRQPCTHLSFYDDGKKVITGFTPHINNVGIKYTHSMCANPKTAVAARSCCGIVIADRAELNYKFEYHGEIVTAETNEAQCIADGGYVCDPTTLKADNPIVDARPKYNAIFSSQNIFYWTDAPCTQQVKVRRDGMVTIVHNPMSSANPSVPSDTVLYVKVDSSINYISVPWQRDPMTGEEIYPTVNNTCGNGACSPTDDDHCLCLATIEEDYVFDSLPSREDVLTSLHVGAFDPETYSGAFDYEIYINETYASDDVGAFVSSDAYDIGDTSTIFEVIDEFGQTVYLKNFASKVTLGGAYTLRNPVGFIDLAKVEERDAEYEVDAFLKHLIRYRSAAPFICKKLIQYFGISNPPPAYVERVTKAFMSGSFTSHGTTFGDGNYGSLAAVSAAITLDAEALSSVVDEDPISGNIREPLLKVIQVMRSLNFGRRQYVKLRYGLFDSLQSKIGQMAFEPPDQFSFFSSDYSPPGSFATTELVSPESQLLSIGNVIGLTNGFFSLFSYGLAFADGGFGPYMDRLPAIGDYSSSVGFLSYEMSTNELAKKIDDLSTMITAGRLSQENKQVLIDAYKYFSKAHDKETGDRVLLQLMTALPEFHTSNTVRKTGSPRTVTPPLPKGEEPYKAIVFINLFGGIDSFNILTPHNEGGCYLYDDYFEARGGDEGIGLTIDEMLTIDGSSAGIDGCNTFGVNSMLSTYKDIYDEGKGIFLANMGHLHKPVTKENWLTETRTDLFSHHTMKAEEHSVDAFKEGDGPGVLGRMLDVLQGYDLAVSSTSVNTNAMMLEGSPTTGRLADVMSPSGVPRVFEREFLKGDQQELRVFLESLHSETGDNSGAFANKWSQSFVDIWNKTDSLVTTLRSVQLSTDFTQNKDIDQIAKQLKMVAELIAAREERGNGINRDVFYVQMGGFDTHSELKEIMNGRLPSLNDAIASFWAEMKVQGIADSVTTIVGSEFGRTITPNSNLGSDHGWGGNYFIFGGDVKGGKILGEYPRSFSESDERNIGRGRLIPSRSWDSLWFGVAQWFGISDQEDLDRALPNSQNFGCDLFTDVEMFNSGWQVAAGCGGPVFSTDVSLQVSDARYFTGEEQKNMCKLAVAAVSKQMLFDPTETRCYISNQVIQYSTLLPGMYEVSGVAVLNFDSMAPPEMVSGEKIQGVSAATKAYASDFVVAGAIPTTEAPSASPSWAPSISSPPSSSPSVSSKPSSFPSSAPSHYIPPECEAPSSVALVESAFGGEFTSSDLGYVGVTGFSFYTPHAWVVSGSGTAIYFAVDGFHYMYLPTQGDVTVTALVNSFQATNILARGGIMFRGSLAANSPHYSMVKLGSNDLSNTYRECHGCSSMHAQTDETKPDSVWLRVSKVGSTHNAYFKHVGDTMWTLFGSTQEMSYPTDTFYVGFAVSASDNAETEFVCGTNFELTRECAGSTEDLCHQASNCEWGPLTDKCYDIGQLPVADREGTAVSSIFDVGQSIESFGCNNEEFKLFANDGTTEKYSCDRKGIWTEDTGLLINPTYQKMTIVRKIRVYAANRCPNCDPVRFELFGRKTSDSPFVSIEIDNFPWKDNRPTRNYVPGLTINSSYASGDTSFSYTDIKLANVEPYLDYKLVFLETRGPKQKNLQFGEIEFPGVLMPEWFGPNDRLLL